MTTPVETVWKDEYHGTDKTLDYAPVVKYFVPPPKPTSYKAKCKFIMDFERHYEGYGSKSSFAVDIKAHHLRFPAEWRNEDIPNSVWDIAAANFWESDWEYLRDEFQETHPDIVFYTEGRSGGWLMIERANGRKNGRQPQGDVIPLDIDTDTLRYEKKWAGYERWLDLQRRIKVRVEKWLAADYLRIVEQMEAEYNIRLSMEMRNHPYNLAYWMSGMIVAGKLDDGYTQARERIGRKIDWLANTYFFAENILVSDIRKAAEKYAPLFIAAFERRIGSKGDPKKPGQIKLLTDHFAKRFRRFEPHPVLSWEDDKLNEMVDDLHAVLCLVYDMAVAFTYQNFEAYCEHIASPTPEETEE